MAKRYPGIKEITPGKRYQYNFQIDGKRKWGTVEAFSMKEAYQDRVSAMAKEQQTCSWQYRNEKERLNITFDEAWEKLKRNLMSRNLSKKTISGIKACYDRMFYEFRQREFPQVENFKDLLLPFFIEYQSYYVVTLQRSKGLRSELNRVKSIMHRLNKLGYCTKELIVELKEIKRPAPNKKTYPEISKNDIDKLLRFIKNDRPDYYMVIYFMRRTGRRRTEVTLLEKKDVITKGFKPIRINVRAETTKKRKEAPLEYLDEDLERHVRSALSGNKTKWLFPNRLGNRCTPNRVSDYLKATSKKVLGIEITPHYFRHRLVTESLKKNINPEDIKAVTGIRDTEVLLGYYTHRSIEGQRQVFDVTV